jgi:hypothetical protein
VLPYLWLPFPILAKDCGKKASSWFLLSETGKTNVAGERVYDLKQGDAIKVTVSIPANKLVTFVMAKTM